MAGSDRRSSSKCNFLKEYTLILGTKERTEPLPQLLFDIPFFDIPPFKHLSSLKKLRP